MFFTEPNSTPLTNRFIGGTYDYDERNTIYFAQNGIFKCAGYLIAWRLAIGSGQCLFGLEPPLFSGFTISNKFLFKPGEDLEISDLGRSASYYPTSSHIIIES